MIKNHTKGFTLIETIIYIGLFSLLLSSVLTTAYNLIQSSGELEAKSTTVEEGGFVLRKISWTLRQNGANVPSHITYNSAGKSILMSENGNSALPITTRNVMVSNLEFTVIPSSGTKPRGVSATFTIDGVTFTTIEYLRQ